MWRIGLPIVALLVSLLAIPLGLRQSAGRALGQSDRCRAAVRVYLNVLNTVQAYVQQGRLVQDRRVGRARGVSRAGRGAVCAARLHAALAAAPLVHVVG